MSDFELRVGTVVEACRAIISENLNQNGPKNIWIDSGTRGVVLGFVKDKLCVYFPEKSCWI